MTTQLSFNDEMGITPLGFMEYLILINLPEKLTKEIRGLKKFYLRDFGYAGKIDSPAHISLFNFKMLEKFESEWLKELESILLLQAPFLVTTHGFDVFGSHTLYIKPRKADILRLQDKMNAGLGIFSKLRKDFRRISTPHITIATSYDLDQFERSKDYFTQKEHRASFVVNRITILKRNSPTKVSEKKWKPIKELHLGLIN